MNTTDCRSRTGTSSLKASANCGNASPADTKHGSVRTETFSGYNVSQAMTINIPVGNIKSWKTSAAGLIALLVGAWQAQAAGMTLSQALHDPAVQLALITGIGLMLAKDTNVTGGTVGQPSSPQALRDANQAEAGGTVGQQAEAVKQ